MLQTTAVYGGLRPDYYPWNAFLFLYALCLFICLFPFLVTDLYYAYRDTSCVLIKPPPGTNIQISMKQWLQVDGYVILVFIIIFLVIGIVAFCYPERSCVYGLWEGLHVLFVLFRLSWLIVGAVMFWKGYCPNNSCKVNVARYIWALLIIGFILLPFQLLLAFLYPKPVLFPVAVPILVGFGSGGTNTGLQPTTPIYRPGGVVY